MAGYASDYRNLPMPTFRHCFLFVALIAVLVIFGCTSTQTPAQLGWRHGCETGYSVAGRPGFETVYLKDDALFAKDASYRNAWTEAQNACYAEAQNSPSVDLGLIFRRR
jgi:hypothetical protein